MSAVSRAELEAMSHDDLVEYILDLQTTVDEFKTRVQSIERTRKPIVERIEALEAENDRLRERLDTTEATAQGAIRAARDTGSRSKTQLAADITRNVLVTRAAQGGPAAGRKVTIRDIQDKAEPDHQLAWAIVDRAWSTLREQWPQFYETTKDGQKALNIRADEITPALAMTVQTDLGRDDVAKPFVGDEPPGGPN